VILVDNAGYTIERSIHGPDADYNGIQPWEWSALPGTLGGPAARGVRVTTVGELDAALADAGDGLLLIQAVVPQLDVPELLAAISGQAAAQNTAPPSH
jgi:indolepyruvate decarboxylase